MKLLRSAINYKHIIFSLLLIIYICIEKFNIINKMKICICTYGKIENRYIREFVQHYKEYGIDKIFLYDNNYINGEKYEEVINDYITKGFVEILNWRGKKFVLRKIMNDCYLRNYLKYDWLMFYEIDEFIHFKNYKNIKYFLNEKKFVGCDLVHLNLLCHTDNNLLYYENKTLRERFPKIVSPNKTLGRRLEIKFILKGHIPNIRIDNVHRCNTRLISCNGFGSKHKYRGIYSTQPDYYYYYIDHYYSKSTQEFIEKINKGAHIRSIGYKLHRIDKYFNQNDITKEKIEMIEKGTGFNLSNYKKKLKSLS